MSAWFLLDGLELFMQKSHHTCSTGTWAAEQPKISPAFVHAFCTFIFHHNALIMHITMCTGEGQADILCWNKHFLHSLTPDC